VGRFARAISGGWHGLDTAELENGVDMLQKMHRWTLPLARPHPERLLLAHFDVRFGSECRDALNSFRKDERREVAAVSSTAVCHVSSTEVPVVLQIKSLEDRLSTRLVIDLDLDRIRIPARDGENDGLCIRCSICCGSSGVVTSQYLLRRFDSTGMMPMYHAWHGLYKATTGNAFCSFVPEADGLLHIARLELYRGSAEGGDAAGTPAR